MTIIPDPNVVFPNEYKTSCFIKNVITAPNITVGDYSYYDDTVDPAGFEKNKQYRSSPMGLAIRNFISDCAKNFGGAYYVRKYIYFFCGYRSSHHCAGGF